MACGISDLSSRGRGNGTRRACFSTKPYTVFFVVRPPAGEHFVEHDAERVDVGPCVDIALNHAPARAPCTPACP